MKYLSLQLKGYKRLSYNNIDSFTIEPTEPFQLILGTNGSGKSSLIQELSPLPGDGNDFNEGGCKAISIEHNNAMYDLTSTFEGKQSHSFFKSGVEMNPGGTVTVQKELVRQEFGVTVQTHALAISQTSLTSMKAPERRYWFTKLSDTNYDYAIAVYNRLKEKSRDVSGAMKLLKKRLVNETAKLVSKEERDLMSEEVEGLHSLLQHMNEYRKPMVKTLDQYNLQKRQLEDKIFQSYEMMTRKMKVISSIRATHKVVLDVAGVDDRLMEIRSIKKVSQIMSDKNFEEYIKLQEYIDAIKITGGKGEDKFNKEIVELNGRLEALLRGRRLNLDLADAANAKSALDTVYDLLTTVFSTLPVNEGKKYSRNKLNETNELIVNISNTLVAKSRELSKLEAAKVHQEHQRDNEQTTCPHCSHKWAKGYDKNYHESLDLSISNLQEAIDESTSSLAEAKLLSEEIHEYSVNYKKFLHCANTWTILNPFWTYLQSGDLIARSPAMVLSAINDFKGDLEIDVKADALRKEIKRTTELLNISKSVEEGDLGELNAKMEKVYAEMSLAAEQNQSLVNEEFALEHYKRNLNEIKAMLAQIEDLGLCFTNIQHEHYEAFRTSALHEGIRFVQLTLANKQKLLSEINSQVTVITEIEKQIAQHERDDNAYKLVLKELSPTDGLIAQGLMGFIHLFVKQMNAFIKKIWLYPLKIVPCGIDKNGELELDYMFPLMANDKDPVSDVVKGSSAMREVVDLAFKLTAMRYLGLESYPLFLDEFASSLDSAHRVTAIEAIKGLMESSSFSQLYMISHYENSYSSLTNAQICVICPDNVVIPDNAVVNTHITVT